MNGGTATESHATPRGRDREIGRLLRLLDGAQQAHGGVVALVGPPGIGKSTMLQWVRDRAAERGFGLLSVRAADGERALPYAGLLTLLRPLEAACRGLPAAERQALDAVLGVDPSPAAGRAVAVALLRLLDELAASCPQLLLVDDAHWLDAETAAALDFVARRIEHTRLAIALARRDVDGLGQLTPDVIELGGLDADAARSLLDDLGYVDASVAKALWAATGGNPLALTESFRSLDDRTRRGLSRLPDPLPIEGRVVELYAARLRAMPTPTVELLLLAAVDESGELWPSAADAPPAALEPAVDARLVRIDSGRVVFRHPLVRTAVLLGTDDASRRAAHRRLASTAAAAGDLDHHALHVAAAAIGPDAVAAELLGGVASRARARGALASAAAAAYRAAQLEPDPGRRTNLLVDVGRDRWMLGDAAGAVDALAAARDATDDPMVRADVALLAGPAALWVTGHDAAAATLLGAVPSVRDDPGRQVALLCQAVNVHLLSGRASDAVATARRALDASSGSGPELATPAAIACALAELIAGSGAADLSVLDTAETLVAELCEAGYSGAAELAPAVAIAATIRDRYAPASRLLVAAASSARTAGMEGLAAFAAAVSSDIDWRTGRWTTPWAGLQAVEQLGQEQHHLEVQLLASAYLTRLAAALDDEPRLRELTAFVMPHADRLGLDVYASWSDAAVGFFHLGRGEWAAAATLLTSVESRTRRGGMSEPGVVWWQADLVEALAAAGRTDAAERTLRRFERDSACSASRWAPLAVARCRALLAPDAADALARATDAVDGFDDVGMPFERARALLVRAALGRRGADDDREEARALFASLGARAWERRASVGRVPSEPSPLLLLTPAERRVALCVAAGRSNREAADELYLSVRTVDFHLQRIFRKLGVRNRTELTRLVGHEATPLTRPG